MKKSWYFWVPRVLAILFIALISLFALDAFEGNAPFGEKLLGFFIHLVPTYMLVILLFIAWKRPLPGGILYTLAGGSYFLLTSDQHWSAYLIVTGIPMLIGTLFIAEHFLAQRSTPLV
jgi:hypothetical protein